MPGATRGGRGRSKHGAESKHGDERRSRELEFHAHENTTMGFTSVEPEWASLAPSLSIAKGSAIAMDRRRDIIVVERTMLRTDCDTYASLLAPPSGRGRSRRLSIRPREREQAGLETLGHVAGLGDRLVRLGFG